jgi:hypothetical protein
LFQFEPFLLLQSQPSPPEDLRKLRKSIGWQAARYEDKVWHGIIPLTSTRPDKFVYFSAYALTGLAPPFSSFFFFMLLKTYDL